MSERYEREIEEIMGEAGDLRPRRPLRQHFKDAQERAGQSLRQEAGHWLRWLTPKKVGGLGAVVLIASLFARSPAVIGAAIGLLLLAYLLVIARGQKSFKEQTGYEKTWRGEPVKYSNNGGGADWRGRFRRFFGKKK